MPLIRAYIIFIISVMFASAASADIAKLNVLGFTKDGERFVFEERGIADGSGHAYANIYVINTETDTWAEGSPIRVGGEGEGDSEWKAILKARQLFKDKGFAEQFVPGNLVASYQPAQSNLNKSSAIFYDRNETIKYGRLSEVLIETYPLKGPEYCESFGIRPVGMRIKIGAEGAANATISEDQKLPKSRGCVMDYDIAEIRTYFPDGNNSRIVIIIAMQQRGFEGSPQIRHMAVTVPLPAQW